MRNHLHHTIKNHLRMRIMFVSTSRGFHPCLREEKLLISRKGLHFQKRRLKPSWKLLFRELKHEVRGRRCEMSLVRKHYINIHRHVNIQVINERKNQMMNNSLLYFVDWYNQDSPLLALFMMPHQQFFVTVEIYVVPRILANHNHCRLKELALLIRFLHLLKIPSCWEGSSFWSPTSPLQKGTSPMIS